MTAVVERDHHGLRIIPEIRREPIRRWFAVVIGVVAVVFLPVPFVSQAIAAGILVAAGILARDRRRTEILVDHDTLTVETQRLGWPVRYRAPWDDVELDSSWDPMALRLQIGEVRLRLPWGGSRATLEDTLRTLREAKASFVPGQGFVEPPPANLTALRDPPRSAARGNEESRPRP